MTEKRYSALGGSERKALSGSARITPVPEDELLSVTLVLRRRAELPAELIHGLRTVSPQELAERYGADPADITTVTKALGRFELRTLEVDAGSRRVRVEGSARAFQRAFGADLVLRSAEDPDGRASSTHRYRTGALQVPVELAGLVTAVLGLDDRPQAQTRLRVVPAQTRASSYTPLQLERVYNFPPGTTGSGQSLAIIELGGGFSQTELRRYFTSLGVASPTVAAVSVDGAGNKPEGDPNGADGEVVLDIEVAGALASGAKVFVYFAPNTDRGFLDAVSQAAHATPTPTAISISWGSSEDAWTKQARDAMNQAFADAAALGVTVTAAAGDSGSSDGDTRGRSHVDFPAASPYVLGCGGTRLVADPTTGAVRSETVWNAGPGAGATGGGVSDVFPAPAWQAQVVLPRPGRGVPDVAAVADPATGYQVLVDGESAVVGGTSAVAPLWAALVCRLAEALGQRLGLLQPLIYPQSPGSANNTGVVGFRDITSGDNGAYSAGPGWDPCTGLGVPNGVELLDHLRKQAGSAAVSGKASAAPGRAARQLDPEDWRGGAGSSRDLSLERDRPPHWG